MHAVLTVQPAEARKPALLAADRGNLVLLHERDDALGYLLEKSA